MKAVDLRQKNVKELRQELLDLLREQFNLRMQKDTGQFSQVHQLSAVRRNIARIKTIIREKTTEGN